MATNTQDGYPLNVGDSVWIRSSVIGGEPTEHIVGKILEHKIEYADPEVDGYIGAKLTAVFHLKENAYWPDA